VLIIFGPNRDEVKGEWRKLHGEELYDVQSSPSIIRVVKLRRTERGWTCRAYGERESCIQCFGGGET